jgi:YcaO-like protein with predicted kinase domain
VARLAKVTGLDRLDIPNYYAVRPSARNSCAVVSGGKGINDACAILSALFEAFERWAAEECLHRCFIGSKEGLSALYPEIPISAPRELDSKFATMWIVGFDLNSNTPCFSPLQCVVFPWADECPPIPGVPSDTNGVAAGTNALEAIYVAILELIERDALARLAVENSRPISAMSLEGCSSHLYHQFEDAGLDLILRSLDSPTGIPVVYSLCRDDAIGISHFFCSGSSAHTDASEAAQGALTEVSQSRIGFISTIRDDIGPRIEQKPRVSYSQRRSDLLHWFTDAQAIPLASLGCRDGLTYRARIDDLVKRIDRVFQTSICIARLRRYSGLCAFRAFSPGLLPA